VQVDRVGDGPIAVVVVTVHGFVDAGSVGQLREHLDELLRQGAHRFVIDLTDVPFMDSSGLATLVQTFKRVRIGEGDVRLAGLQDEVRRVFELVRLNRVFDLFPDASAGVASFDVPHGD